MNYKVRYQMGKKDFQILESNIPIIKGSRPSWFSSKIIFFYNNKTYEIQKISFWKSQYKVTAGGVEVAKIIVKSFLEKRPYSKKGYFIQILENGRIKEEYSVTKTTKSMWSSATIYNVIYNNSEILEIEIKRSFTLIIGNIDNVHAEYAGKNINLIDNANEQKVSITKFKNE